MIVLSDLHPSVPFKSGRFHPNFRLAFLGGQAVLGSLHLFGIEISEFIDESIGADDEGELAIQECGGDVVHEIGVDEKLDVGDGGCWGMEMCGRFFLFSVLNG